MNVTELARRLRMNTQQLLEILPEYGFDIGRRAIKIDDRTASQVLAKWKEMKRDLDRKRQAELEAKKQKERELRRQEGKQVLLPHRLSVRAFAEILGLSVSQVMIELMKNGILANQNQDIDYETAAIIGEELGFLVSPKQEENHQEEKEEARGAALEEALKQARHLERRPPVVVVMGHVDHGKTTLLDTIRKTNVVATESGGITQHIGAYQTVWKDPKSGLESPITFIDTPGHEAFTIMRSRGAKVADIAILLVAADDSVKPQTEEVLQIIKAAKLPFVVAVNKVDKEGADVQRVKADLAQRGVQPEDWGGEVPFVEISAKKNLSIDRLLDTLLVLADMQGKSIQADPGIPAVGTVIESHKDKNIGPVATILLQAGTLKNGDPLVINGEIYGKVRAMRADTGRELVEASPSTPIQILGFKVAPEIGDILDVGRAATAKKIDVRAKQTQQTGAEKATVSVDQSAEEEQKKKFLNIVLKADVLGSLEAILGSLGRIRHDEVGVRVIGKGLGNVTESDIAKAEAASGVLVGFHVNPTPTAEQLIRDKNLPLKRFDVIYALMDWVKEELEGLLAEKKTVVELGVVKILAVFRKDKRAMTVGGRVEIGKIETGATVRVRRDTREILGIGTISMLKIGQQEVKEVPQGTECGIRFEGKFTLEKGDVLEAYREELLAKKIEIV